MRLGTFTFLAALSIAGCGEREQTSADAHADVSPHVLQANAAVAQAHDLSDPASQADARKGWIASPKGQVKDAQGRVIWDYDAFAFVKGQAPETVNPSLWRQALLNNQIGLFKVTEGIYQLRGFDLANITLIEGNTGWIVIDTATSQESSRAAMAFARQHLGVKPVSAVVFTHSHVDHFGGVLGVVSAQEVRERHIPIVAPVGFMEEATSENLLMGVAMGRRSQYMYGSRLNRDAQGLVDNGLGKAVAYGTIGILPPTVVVDQARQEVMLDGRQFVFYNVPGSEAPSEMVFEVPELKAFNGAELMGQTLHNLYTLRGAKVRDALKWANYLDQTLAYAANAEVLLTQHHWPVWGRANIAHFIEQQRDVYKFLHDQTVRQMNAGLTGPEIAEGMRLPKSLQDDLKVHGYYGTVSHNTKAIYQYYMGWYDGNPANLNPLPPAQVAQRYVELGGGADALVANAQKAYDKGEFRWAAEVLKHVVYAQPDHAKARQLQAKAFEQMGFMAESAPWRNVYLSGAYELRKGPPDQGMDLTAVTAMLEQTPIERFLERMAASIDGMKNSDVKLTVNLVFSDLKESHVLKLNNGVLLHHKAPPDPAAQATLTLTQPFFLKMVTGQAGAKDLLLSDQTKITGSTLDLAKFFAMIEKSPGTFPIVTRP
jgi:alkyl sulfatase BDS1-like metallo-beta-lactamase superfamily hydrolase